MKINKLFPLASMAVVLLLGAPQVAAQDPAPPQGGPGGCQGGPGGGPGGGRNFDPAQMQQRMMDRYKEQLEVADDTEWKVIQTRVEKVFEARRQVGFGGGRFGRGGRPGGGNAPGAAANAGGGQRRGGPQAEPSAEAEALQKAIDGKASSAELKAATEKFVAARKDKQAALEKAQADLRKVLTPRQEAIATLNGLL